MDAVPWWDILHTGHAQLEAEHKQLVDLFNELADGVKDHKDRACCEAMLDDVIRTAKSHFEREEALMLEQGYPSVQQHIADHAALLNKAREYKLGFDVDSAEDCYWDLVRFAEVWLCFHILFADKDFGEFLAQKERGAAARAVG